MFGRPLLAAQEADNRKHSALLLAFGYAGHADLALANTRADAALVERRLKALKFGQVVRVEDADLTKLEALLASFVGQLRSDGLAFVYIAGHGVQIDGANYLLLADGKTFIDMQSIIETVRPATGTSVFMLDMCRNNPFRALPSDATGVRAIRGASRALAAGSIAAPGDAAGLDFNFTAFGARSGGVGKVGAFELRGTGVRVVFATDPQNTAADYVSAYDANSPFATAIAQRLSERRSLDDVITLTTGDVVSVTQGAQSPWSQGSLGQPIYLAGPPKPKNPARPPFQVPG
ncbi:hypothetical protein ACFB49_46380 [Sphingomonas sp. DBB INV C78]|uniref:caspase family protein n=1 Tax=Sphingomonas sp. DBB INV C78 TaxID=3349434 RepID=UPI0036D29D6E